MYPRRRFGKCDRSRWLGRLRVGVLLVLGVNLTYFSVPGGASVRVRITDGRHLVTSARQIEPSEPGSLAVGPDGDLYLSDTGSHEILKRLPSGRFVIVAGTGEEGLSGDGGLAVRAKTEGPGNLAVARNGDLFFTQAGTTIGAGHMPNTVIREVATDGVIRSVAGQHPDCRASWLHTRSLPAEDAEMFGARLAIGTDGRLEVQTLVCPNVFNFDRLLELTNSRDLVEIQLHSAQVAGDACANPFVAIGMTVFGCWGQPGQGPKLLVVRSDGSTIAFPIFGAAAALVATGNGEVVALHNTALVRVESSGLQVIATDQQFERFIPGAIAVMDKLGLAVDSRGDIFVTLDAFVGKKGCAAGIFEVRVDGRIIVLWHSARRGICY